MIDVNVNISGTVFSLREVFGPFIVKPLFVIFVYFGMFARTSGMFGLSGGMITVLVSFGLFALACIHMFLISNRNSVSPLAFLIIIFFAVSAFTPLVSGFIYNERMIHVLRFVIELGICFGMFFSVYYFVREGVISPKFVVYSFAILGCISALQIFSGIFGLSSYVRLGREIGGLNYIGNTIAVSAVCFMMILNAKKFQSSKKFIGVTLFLIVFLTLIMTGTRAGFIAFLAGLFLYQVFGIKSRKLTIYAIAFALLIVIAIIILSFYVNLNFLLQRYTYEELSKMAMIRFNLFYSSVADLTLVEFLFGRADLSAIDKSLVSVSRYVNPHNVFLSLIRFTGLIPFILFFAAFVVLFLNYFKIYYYHRQNARFRIMETTIIIFLALSFINVMVSGGKFTRNFYLFFAIGYAIGYIDLLKRVDSEKEYSELIL